MPAIFNYLVVDDEEIDRVAIEVFASGFSSLRKISSCANALEALELINRFRPDIVFADIEMPGISGLELIRNMSGLVPAPVFVTSHPEFAADGYELQAFDYLVKPVSKERFEKCVHRIVDFFQLRDKAVAFEKENESNFIIVKEGYDKYRIQLQDILYLEAMKDYTRIRTTDNQYLVLGTLTGLHERLPSKDFIRIHRSYIVNWNKIKSAKGNKIAISNYELPIGKLYKKAIEGMF